MISGKVGVILLEGDAGGLVARAVLSNGSCALIMSEGDVGGIAVRDRVVKRVLDFAV